MSHTVESHQSSAGTTPEAAIKCVDCDVHPIFADSWSTDLIPYMTREWGRRIAGAETASLVDGKDRNLGNFRLAMPRSIYPVAGIPPLREDLLARDIMPCSDPIDTAEYLLDGCGVDRAILQPQGALPLGDIPSIDSAAVLASAINDWLADKWLGTDPRYRGTIAVAMQEPKRAAAEIRRMAPNRNFVAVQIPLSSTLLGHPINDPIFEAAQEFGLPVILHPNNGSGQYALSAQLPGGVPNYMLEIKGTFAYIYAAQMASMVANGTFQKFPGLKVAFVEVAYAWAPDLMWRLDAFWRTARDDTPWLEQPPSEIIVEHCRFVTQPFVEPPKHKYIAQMFEMLEAEKTMMFATDYPHWNSEEPWAVEKLIPESYRHRVMADNAIEFFGDRLF